LFGRVHGVDLASTRFSFIRFSLVKKLPRSRFVAKNESSCSDTKTPLANPIKQAGANKLKDQYPLTSITAWAKACGAS